MLPNYRVIKTLTVAALLYCPPPVQAGILLELYQQALSNNPTLLSKHYAVDQAQAREDQAFSKLLPSASATGAYSQNQFHGASPTVIGQTATQNYPGLRGTVQARQALFDLASYLRFRGAEDTTRQANAEEEAYRLELAGDLIDRYLAALEAVDKISFLQEDLSSVAIQIKRLTEMQKRQMVKVTDVYEVQAYYEQLNTQKIEAENEKAIALEKLREITGTLPLTLDLLSIQLFPKAPSNVEKWITDAIQANPNLVALQAALESAKNTVAANKADHLPVLALMANETYSDQSFDNRRNPPYNIGSVSLQVTVPIYEGGRVEASVREARAREQMVLQQFEKLKREIERETRSSFLNASASESRIDSTFRHVDAIKKTFNAKQQGYELGANTIVDVLQSQREVYKAQMENRKACYDYARSLIMLRIWTGGLNIENVAEIDNWFAGSSNPEPATK